MPLFDKMQYCFDPPGSVLHLESRIAIKDSEGRTIGFFGSRMADLWLEDSLGGRHCDIRSNGYMTFGITDPANLPLGMIRYPPPRQSPSKKFLDQFGLFDASNQLVAYSDPFSYAINWNLSLSASDSFNGLKKNGLYVRAPDGNVLAIIHGSNNSDGCQVDLYNSDVNQTLVMSLIAFILTLPYPH